MLRMSWTANFFSWGKANPLTASPHLGYRRIVKVISTMRKPLVPSRDQFLWEITSPLPMPGH